MGTSDALRAAYESVRDRTNATFGQFAESVRGWKVVPVRVDDELAGAVLINGPELHACILPKFFGRWLSRKVLRDTLHRVLDTHGHAITRTTSGNQIGDAFVARLGFRKIGDADGVATYRLEVKNGN